MSREGMKDSTSTVWLPMLRTPQDCSEPQVFKGKRRDKTWNETGKGERENLAVIPNRRTSRSCSREEGAPKSGFFCV